MGKKSAGIRILIYSHDTFGLGHLRRCNAIAQSLVERRKGLSVLILSGSPIIGSFDFRTRVDFVRVPGVIKLQNGDYSSLNLHMDIGEVVHLRAAIIQHTAEVFRPDLFLVDKEPLGLRGEIHETLKMLKAAGTPCVLGLRDVMDDPELLAKEWERKDVVSALREFYDDIWVYGLPQVCEPLAGLDVPDDVSDKINYTGYIRRTLSRRRETSTASNVMEEPYLLVTAGGGGDGQELMDWVISAYEADPDIPHPALVLFGPFMAKESREAFRRRIEALERVQAITFDSHAENLMAGAVGVVAMGGYNTFCEILSLDKRAVIVPRVRPRREQLMRAASAQELGLIRMVDGETRDPLRMAAVLRSLPNQPRPSEVVIPGLLDGLDNIHRLVDRWIGARRRSDLDMAVPGA